MRQSWATLLLLASLITHVRAGNVYRRVDEQGRVHCGDAASMSFGARSTSDEKESEITDSRRQDAHQAIGKERDGGGSCTCARVLTSKPKETVATALGKVTAGGGRTGA